jgi:hypothetical protein
MKFHVRLVDPDEDFYIEPDARDMRAFELKGMRALGLKGSCQEALNQAPQTWTAWIIWHAVERRGGRDLGGYDAFEARLLVTPRDESGDIPDAALGNPTGPASLAG